jgi:twitching motility protein PilT
VTFDLNNLKWCNDNLGHAAGDAYIQASARIIKEKKTNQIQTVLQSNMQTGMHTMNYSLANLVKTRVISRDVALKFSENPTELAKSI